MNGGRSRLYLLAVFGQEEVVDPAPVQRHRAENAGRLDRHALGARGLLHFRQGSPRRAAGGGKRQPLWRVFRLRLDLPGGRRRQRRLQKIRPDEHHGEAERGREEQVSGLIVVHQREVRGWGGGGS